MYAKELKTTTNSTAWTVLSIHAVTLINQQTSSLHGVQLKMAMQH
jgi:hypothetical protein